MDKTKIINFLAENKAKFSQIYGVKTLGLFGSFARGDQTDTSDIDILVEFDRPVGFEIVDLTLELEEQLKTSVDVVSKKALSPALKKLIEEEVIYV